MKRAIFLIAVLVVCSAPIRAADEGKVLHLKIDVTVPQAMVEKDLPVINHGNLHQGKLAFGQGKINGMDFSGILAAMRNAPPGQFITIDSGPRHLQIGRDGENLVIKATGGTAGQQEMNISVPFAILQALFSLGKGQLDLMSAAKSFFELNQPVKMTLSNGQANVQISVETQ